MHLQYEGVDFNDPLSILISAESEDDSGADELESLHCAAKYRARSFEVEKLAGDLMGASPFEIASAETKDED